MAYYHSLIRRSRLYPALWLEAWLDARRRQQLIQLTLALLLIGGPLAYLSGFWSRVLSVVGLLLLVLLIKLIYLELYFRSYYYPSIVSNLYDPTDLVTFTVGRILISVDLSDDVTRAFGRSAVGREILARLGVSATDQAAYWRERRASALPPLVAATEVLTLAVLVAGLWQHDEGFRSRLLSWGITEGDFLGAAAWQARLIESAARQARWWSREHLATIPPLAADWSYGGIYTLDRYSHQIVGLGSAEAMSEGGRRPELGQLVTILERDLAANALLVGPTREAGLGLVWQLAGLLRRLSVPPLLRGKKIILFETALFTTAFRDRADLEQELLKIFNEAAGAGNVILVIDDLANLLRAGNALAADLASLLAPFLEGNALQVIALSDLPSFQAAIMPNPTLLSHFEKLSVGALAAEESILFAEEKVALLEARHPVRFTYQALALLAESAFIYFQTDSGADKVNDLVTEMVAWLSLRGERWVTKARAEEFLGQKTHVPMGRASAAETEKLLGLEERLAGRVVGQDAAVNAIAKAMRRGRAGVRNPKRPLASFLFLGPTGVGKTETAKALAAEFFEAENLMLRFDMSEFQGEDALPKLIGSFERGEAGLLAGRIREQPYGVLLLDEFEKAHPGVRNLFLQILDEGFFTDAAGRRVNARNLIIIATSNAGAAEIWQMVEAGQDPVAAKPDLIQKIIASGVYSPELLNRFDDVIIFNPLKAERLLAVAELQLKRLAERLYRDHAMILELTPETIRSIAERGANQAFGARPMQRFIQDELEEKIATALIRGDIKSGSRVKFTNDLALVAA